MIGQPTYPASMADIVSHIGEYIDAEILASRNVELGYAEITSTFSQVAAASTNYDITGLVTTVEVEDRPILIETVIPSITHTVASTSGTDIYTQLRIYEGATLLALSQQTHPVRASGGFNLRTIARLAPSAGSHTYKAVIRSVSAGTITISAAASTIIPSISVVER